MKIVFIVIIAFVFCTGSKAQSVELKENVTVENFRTYLLKNTMFPAAAVESNVQGKMVVNFKIDSNQKITVISFIRHLTGECDSAVVHAIRQYPYKLALPSAEYTIGFQFLLLDGGKPDSDIKPFDKSLYKNFLFEMNVTSEFPQRKPSIVY